jgi:hypothetical protein
MKDDGQRKQAWLVLGDCALVRQHHAEDESA